MKNEGWCETLGTDLNCKMTVKCKMIIKKRREVNISFLQTIKEGLIRQIEEINQILAKKKSFGRNQMI